MIHRVLPYELWYSYKTPWYAARVVSATVVLETAVLSDSVCTIEASADLSMSRFQICFPGQTIEQKVCSFVPWAIDRRTSQDERSSSSRGLRCAGHKVREKPSRAFRIPAFRASNRSGAGS